MIFICIRMKNHFDIKGWGLNLVLMQRPGGTRKWPTPTGARNFGRHVNVHQYVQTLRKGKGRLWTEGVGTLRQAGFIWKINIWVRQASLGTDSFQELIPQPFPKTQIRTSTILFKTRVLSANMARQYVKSLDAEHTIECWITKENHRTIILEFYRGNGRKCNADDAWYKSEWYFTQVIMGWRPVVVQFGIQILILAFHLNSLCVEVYSLDKITFKKSIIAGTFAGLCYCWSIKLIQNWVLCSACK